MCYNLRLTSSLPPLLLNLQVFPTTPRKCLGPHWLHNLRHRHSVAWGALSVQQRSVHRHVSAQLNREMAPQYSKLLTRGNVIATAGIATTLWVLLARRKGKPVKLDRYITQLSIYIKKPTSCPFLLSRRKVQKVEEEIQYLISEKKEPSVKAHVNRQFLKNLGQLLRIVIPGWTSKESGLLFLVALSLVARSLCDLWMINNGTKIERWVFNCKNGSKGRCPWTFNRASNFPWNTFTCLVYCMENTQKPAAGSRSGDT